MVIAAGEGRRLRPLTERHPKPTLPIDGRPVLAALLHELVAAGIDRATIVVGHLAEQVEALVGAPGAFGLDVRFVRQPRPDGSADAVAHAVTAGIEPPFVVAAADTLFTVGDVARFVAAFRQSGAAGAVAVRRDPPPDPPHRRPVRIRDGVVERVLDDDPANPLGAAPLWIAGAEVVAQLRCDRPPYELGNSFQAAIDGGAHVTAIEIGETRDLTHPVDLLEENFPYLRAL